MKLPSLTSGSVRSFYLAPKFDWRISGVAPQQIVCGPCESNGNGPCSKECCLYKNGQEINCFDRSCQCSTQPPCCNCQTTTTCSPPGCRHC